MPSIFYSAALSSFLFVSFFATATAAEIGMVAEDGRRAHFLSAMGRGRRRRRGKTDEEKRAKVGIDTADSDAAEKQYRSSEEKVRERPNASAEPMITRGMQQRSRLLQGPPERHGQGNWFGRGQGPSWHGGSRGSPQHGGHPPPSHSGGKPYWGSRTPDERGNWGSKPPNDRGGWGGNPPDKRGGWGSKPPDKRDGWKSKPPGERDSWGGKPPNERDGERDGWGSCDGWGHRRGLQWRRKASKQSRSTKQSKVGRTNGIYKQTKYDWNPRTTRSDGPIFKDSFERGPFPDDKFWSVETFDEEHEQGSAPVWERTTDKAYKGEWSIQSPDLTEVGGGSVSRAVVTLDLKAIGWRGSGILIFALTTDFEDDDDADNEFSWAVDGEAGGHVVGNTDWRFYTVRVKPCAREIAWQHLRREGGRRERRDRRALQGAAIPSANVDAVRLVPCTRRNQAQCCNARCALSFPAARGFCANVGCVPNACSAC